MTRLIAAVLLAGLAMGEVVEFHSLSDWTEISGMSRFLWDLMRQRGYVRPIWVGDVDFTASPPLIWGTLVPPYTEQHEPQRKVTVRVLARAKQPRYAEAEAWFRREWSCHARGY